MDCRFYPNGADCAAAEQAGHRFGDRGTHTSRTIMLVELAALFDACDATAPRADLLHAIVEDNCLSKATSATRQLSAQRLTELYGLNPDIPLFRILRFLWQLDVGGRPQLAILAALARDPLLAATASSVLPLALGAEFQRIPMRAAVLRSVGDRLNDAILDKVCRNAASSWTQAGHLVGRTLKKRRLVSPTPVTLSYALFLAFSAGYRAGAVFASPWVRVLDLSPDTAPSLAMEAKRFGLIDLNISGEVITLDVSRIDPVRRKA